MSLVASIPAEHEGVAESDPMTTERVCPFCAGEGRHVPVSADQLRRRGCLFCRGKGLVSW